MRDSWSRVRTAWSEEREKPSWCQDPSLRICTGDLKNYVDFPYKYQQGKKNNICDSKHALISKNKSRIILKMMTTACFDGGEATLGL